MAKYTKEERAQRRRISRFMREASKRGYSFEYALPEKKLGQSDYAQQLSQIRPSQLYEKATYRNPKTGLTFTGTEGRRIERQLSAKKAAETRKKITEADDRILDQIEEMISGWTPKTYWSPSLANAKQEDKNALQTILDSAITRFGRKRVALQINENAVEIVSLAEEVLYGSGDSEGTKISGRTQVQMDLIRFRNLITGMKLTMGDNLWLTQEQEYQEQHLTPKAVKGDTGERVVTVIGAKMSVPSLYKSADVYNEVTKINNEAKQRHSYNTINKIRVDNNAELTGLLDLLHGLDDAKTAAPYLKRLREILV